MDPSVRGWGAGSRPGGGWGAAPAAVPAPVPAAVPAAAAAATVPAGFSVVGNGMSADEEAKISAAAAPAGADRLVAAVLDGRLASSSGGFTCPCAGRALLKTFTALGVGGEEDPLRRAIARESAALCPKKKKLGKRGLRALYCHMRDVGRKPGGDLHRVVWEAVAEREALDLSNGTARILPDGLHDELNKDFPKWMRQREKGMRLVPRADVGTLVSTLKHHKCAAVDGELAAARAEATKGVLHARVVTAEGKFAMQRGRPRFFFFF